MEGYSVSTGGDFKYDARHLITKGEPGRRTSISTTRLEIASTIPFRPLTKGRY